mmetsp:Transcript_29199/g.32762  ORF Transcript_29199/g.32762 Transcript_29199/m.32762 type:complete len:87 (+) Transcript_29199:175-435(+)
MIMMMMICCMLLSVVLFVFLVWCLLYSASALMEQGLVKGAEDNYVQYRIRSSGSVIVDISIGIGCGTAWWRWRYCCCCLLFTVATC